MIKQYTVGNYNIFNLQIYILTILPTGKNFLYSSQVLIRPHEYMMSSLQLPHTHRSLKLGGGKRLTKWGDHGEEKFSTYSEGK